MPYPLPEGDAYTDVLRWFLVAVPDKPEYVRAGLGAYTEFTKWFLWERDDAKRGADAADAWDEAVAATLEALEMGFPQDLLGYIDEVETLLRALQSVPCCDAPTVSYQGDYDPNLQSEIEDGVGDPPATYGDDPIATWDEWDDYKCEASYFMVERAAVLCEELADIQSWDTPLNAEIIGLALGRIPAVGEVFKAAWQLVWQLLELSWDTIIDLETAAGEIRAAADDIACDIFLADGPDAAAAAFKTAVQDAVTQTGASLVVPWFPYDMWANIIYEGEFTNAEGTTVAIDSLLTPGTNDCCTPDFDFDNTSTAQNNSASWIGTRSGPQTHPTEGSTWALNPRDITSGNASLTLSYANFNANVIAWNQATHEVHIDLLEIDLEPGISWSPKDLSFDYREVGEASNTVIVINETDGLRETFESANLGNINTPGGSMLALRGNHNGNADTTFPDDYCWIHSIRIAGRLVAI